MFGSAGMLHGISRRAERAVAVLVSVAVVAGAAAQSMLLKPKFEPGRVSYVEMQQDTKQTMSGGMFG